MPYMGHKTHSMTKSVGKDLVLGCYQRNSHFPQGPFDKPASYLKLDLAQAPPRLSNEDRSVWCAVRTAAVMGRVQT